MKANAKAAKKKTDKSELTDLQLTILMAAVRIARNDNVRTLPALQRKLSVIWPKKPRSIRRALKYWADYEVSKSRTT